MGHELKIITELVGLQGYQVVEVKVKTKVVEIWMEEERKEYTCQECGQIHLGLYDSWEVTIQDLPAFGKIVYLHLRQVRVYCRCKKKAVKATLLHKSEGHQLTQRLAAQIHEDCKYGTVKRVSQYYRLGWELVKQVDKEALEKKVEANRGRCVATKLALDEYAVGKRHQYMTVITDVERRKVIHVGKHRQSATVKAYFKGIDKAYKSRITDGVIDMWRPYEKALREECPQIRITYDRFHVMREVNRALDDLRKAEYRKAEQEGKELIKGSRFLLLRNEQNIKAEHQHKLNSLLDLNQNLLKGYLLKEQFRAIYNSRDKTRDPQVNYQTAFELFVYWANEVEESGLKSFQKVLKSFKRRLGGILNYFVSGLTNGLSEGLNNVIATIKKMAYGYTDENYFILKIYQKAGLIS